VYGTRVQSEQTVRERRVTPCVTPRRGGALAEAEHAVEGPMLRHGVAEEGRGVIPPDHLTRQRGAHPGCALGRRLLLMERHLLQ